MQYMEYQNTTIEGRADGHNMRTKKAILNSITSLIGEVVSVICGLILPRLILSAFGSDYNGITSSITQFLSCVVLLRAGVGGVTRAALYKPLAEGNTKEVSAIINANAAFMRKVALIFLGFLIVFSSVYPFAVRSNFDWLFTFSLVLIIGSSTFIDTYFGISNHQILMADQRNYINTILQILTTILNTIVAACLIKIGASIHIVKLGSSLVFFIRPIFLYIYVKRYYNLDRKEPPDNTAIAQRWDAFAQQVAAFINNNTDVMVLSLFSDIKEVSVYTVYYTVTNGLYKLEKTVSDGMGAAFGNMLAKNENKALQRNFRMLEFAVFTFSAFLFICGGVLIVPFAEVYTSGITDVSYSRPLVGALMCINQFLFCVRLPYQMLVEAAGHFRQTRNGSIFESVINVVISVMLVIKFGLIGVTIGTFCALIFRTFQYSIYASHNLLHRAMNVVMGRLLVSCLEAISVSVVVSLLPNRIILNFQEWIVYALEVAIITAGVITIFSLLFYKKDIKLLLGKMYSLKQNKKGK